LSDLNLKQEILEGHTFRYQIRWSKKPPSLSVETRRVLKHGKNSHKKQISALIVEKLFVVVCTVTK